MKLYFLFKEDIIMENNKSLNRETWLKMVTTEHLSKLFKQAGNYIIPEDVKVSCGFPPSGNRGTKQKTLGVCFNRASSVNGINEIFISPVLDDTSRVLDVLIHELIHAVDDCVHGHKGLFKQIALAVGLEGKMTATVAGEELQKKLKAIIDVVGEYPHSELKLSGKKQTTRNIKLACNCCEFSFRTSRKNIELMEQKAWEFTDCNIVCPACEHGSLDIEIKEDE
jgi:hypothetical protein